MRVAGAHLTQRRLADKNRSRFLELARDKAVPVGHVIPEQHRAHGGGHILHIRLILHDQRNTVHRPDHAAGLKGLVQPVRFGQRVGIDRNQGVDRRTLLVIGLYPVEIHLHQLARGQRARRERRMDIGDCGFDHIKDIGCHSPRSPCILYSLDQFRVPRLAVLRSNIFGTSAFEPFVRPVVN